MGGIFDFTNGELIFGNKEGNSFMSEDGHLMIKSSNSSMIGLETGDMHLTSSLDDDNDLFKMY